MNRRFNDKSNHNNQPVLILGGFLIDQYAYQPMADWLRSKINIETEIIKATKYDWLLTNWQYGWKRILDRVHESVETLSAKSRTGKITLIGHSSGGVMLRLYLSDKNFAGRLYNGKKYCNRLITLGSPHKAIRQTKLRAYVDREYPGSYYSEEVSYTSIIGIIDLDSLYAKKIAKYFAPNSYKSINGNSSSKGDGLVPISSALLNDSQHILLENIAHGNIFGKYWYGSESKINLWWNKIN